MLMDVPIFTGRDYYYYYMIIGYLIIMKCDNVVKLWNIFNDDALDGDEYNFEPLSRFSQ